MSDNIRGDRSVSFIKHCINAPFGAFVEVGVFEGNSAVIIAQLGNGREFHLYDTWEGLPTPTKEDKKSAKKGQFKAEFETVSEFLENHVRNDCVLVYHKGMVQDTFDEKDYPDGIAFLHIDVDFYIATRFCLERFWHLVKKGAVVQIDDYGHYPGCRKAVDEFARKNKLVIHDVFDKQPSPVYLVK